MKVGDFLTGSDTELGYEVEDAISGVRGTASSMVVFHDGNIQFAVQPKTTPEKNEMHDGWNIDAAQLKFLSEGVNSLRVQAPVVDIALGGLVKDKFTDIEGIATRKVVFLNGCVYYSIARKITQEMKDKGAKETTPHFVNWTQLVKLEPRTLLAPKEVKPASKAQGTARGVGGPSSPAYKR